MVGCPSRSEAAVRGRTNARFKAWRPETVHGLGAGLAEQGETVLEARDLACLRGERVVFAGLSFAVPAGAALLRLTAGLWHALQEKADQAETAIARQGSAL